MSLLANILVIVAVAALAGAVMLVLRRRAPEGGRFADSDRASGVFGILGGAFAILLGFVVLLAFESFSAAEQAGADEAAAVREMEGSAGLFLDAQRREIEGDLVCYARAVIHLEWPLLDEGKRSEQVDAWALALENSQEGIVLNHPRAEVGFGSFLDARNARETARRDRLLEAGNPIPSVLIVLLVVAAIVVLVFVAMYADSAERAFPQALMMASVAALVVASLLGIRFLDTPYGDHPGALEPTEMQYTLKLMQQSGGATFAPCTPAGRPS